MKEELLAFLRRSTTAFQAVAEAEKQLSGYTALSEREDWDLRPGGRYYVTRNVSSLLAFRIPKKDFAGFQMAAAHGDSPCLKLKENAERAAGGYVQLSCEVYGGMLRHSWLDRPLSAAGRVLVRTEDGGAEARLVDLDEDLFLIPSVAIHLNRRVNDDGLVLAPHVDLQPLYGSDAKKGTFRARVAAAAGTTEENLLSTELYLYNRQPGTLLGDEYIASPRLDDLQCAYAALRGFLGARDGESVPVYCLFDNEEVGSMTRQGAASTFLQDTLQRICECCGKTPAQYRRAVADSFLVSCDNAHAVHPNHPELADENHRCRMNGGVVVKYNAGQKYTTDGMSAALFRLVCEEAGVPTQMYCNRADQPGGSTLGHLANSQVSLLTIDVGLAQLAMHSAYETAGADDADYLEKALSVFFGKRVLTERDGRCRLI